MTKNEAREALVGIWRFERVGDLIALREVDLIEAVCTQEATLLPNPPGSYGYTDMRVQHPS